mgnify:CR=1 FL=1
MVKKVLKFGGTSVGTTERIRHVANIIKKEQSAGNKVIAVVSAMAGKTNELIEHSNQISNKFNKREFDVLLLDSSPVGLFPDSNALATKVDDLIFVTRYSKVGRRTAKSMLQKLEETGARILGVVLNDLPEKKSSSYYYGYG